MIFRENDGSFARASWLDQADDMFPVVRPIPDELFGLIIKRMSPDKDRK